MRGSPVEVTYVHTYVFISVRRVADIDTTIEEGREGGRKGDVLSDLTFSLRFLLLRPQRKAANLVFL